eukprot:TRINITY_DN4399_c0_g1_i1.p1 TRINITY_DN4399_c0_g1~~TRINITY_DN4399_c0_g1_i1.p1  ORF type:complete len:529 (-),score=159.28 TRINITY_DN4399_c0_g1_i1:1036-2622(-)
MGISGLLPLLSSITTDVHLHELKGLTAAVDIYCWLHRGAYGCSSELCQNIPTDGYINYCMKRLKSLIDNGITPIVVFDGGPLPIKQSTEKDRKKNREENKAKGLALIREGNVAAARDAFVKAVDITPFMAYRLIKALRRENIQFVVAPYEADAQLAFLSIRGIVDFVISEDSDLLAYGCKRVLFKLNNEGQGKEIQLCNLGSNSNPSLANFTQQMFRQVCILSGCDYLSSLPGLGIKKAHELIKKFKDVDKVLHFLKTHKSFAGCIPQDYKENFWKAEMTFLYQRVFDPLQNRITHLNPLPQYIEESEVDLSFLGRKIDDEMAVQIAIGMNDPHTKELFESYASSQKQERNTPVPPSNNVKNSARIASISAPFASLKTTITTKETKLSSYFEKIEEPRDNVPRKKLKLDESLKQVIAPPTPSPDKNAGPTTILVSKYFSNSSGIRKNLFSVSKPEKENEFISPNLNNGQRLSFRPSFTSSNPQKEEEWSIESDEESEEMRKSKNNLLMDDDGEVIESDSEVIFSDEEG